MPDELKFNPEISIRTLSRQVATDHFNSMLSYIDGIIENQDAEYVHRFRVSTRRLRALLDVYKVLYRSESLPVVIVPLRKVAKATRKARDMDVYIQYLTEYISITDLTSQDGISTLLNIIKSERQALQPKLVSKLDAFQQSSFSRDLNCFLNQTDSVVSSAREAKKSGDSIPALESAGMIIPALIGEIQSLSPGIYRSANMKSLHKMRLAVKRLRYILEAYELYFPQTFEQYIEALKQLQDHLGFIHDSDVQIADLKKRANVQNGLDSNTQLEFIQFLEFQNTRREKLNSSFLVFWEDFKFEDFKNSLINIIRL